MPTLTPALTNGGNCPAMTELFYKLLYKGLLACAGIISAIIAIILWRRMWVGGKSFAELGTEGNGVIFMAVLVGLSVLIAWRIKKAHGKL
ncbi:MAG TPA: hypothetical protein ENJ55_07995 [Rhizobiales bacterium]|nr:hypothetical protein [Hyphomicrobiales bacterium]